MDEDYYFKILKRISASMFNKSFLGIFHGSISAKIKENKFIINKQEAIFDSLENNDFAVLYMKKDYRWNEASDDSDIHLNIYKNIKDAKFIVYATPPSLVAYSFNHDYIIPKDYFGVTKFKKIEIYDPKNFDDWYERAPHEIYNYMQNENTNLVVIRGIGVFAYARDAVSLAKKVAILENSCRLLLLNSN